MKSCWRTETSRTGAKAPTNLQQLQLRETLLKRIYLSKLRLQFHSSIPSFSFTFGGKAAERRGSWKLFHQLWVKTVLTLSAQRAADSLSPRFSPAAGFISADVPHFITNAAFKAFCAAGSQREQRGFQSPGLTLSFTSSSLRRVFKLTAPAPTFLWSSVQFPLTPVQYCTFSLICHHVSNWTVPSLATSTFCLNDRKFPQAIIQCSITN